jgi:hypothetical protein
VSPRALVVGCFRRIHLAVAAHGASSRRWHLRTFIISRANLLVSALALILLMGTATAASAGPSGERTERPGSMRGATYCQPVNSCYTPQQLEVA